VSSVAVVVPARDCASMLPQCLEAVLQQTRRVERIVIAVGPSADDTRSVAERLAAGDPRIVVCDNPAGDRGSGINVALDLVAVDVVAMVDAQSILDPDYVEQAFDALERSQAGVVGGAMRPHGLTPTGKAVAAALTSPFGIGDSQFHFEGEARDVESVYLGVYRADVLREVGPYSSVLLRTEDDDMNERIREAGHRIHLDPAIRSTYLCRNSLVALWNQYHGYGYWKVALACARPSAIRFRHAVPAAFVLGLAVSALVSVRAWRPALPLTLGAYGAAAGVSIARGPALPLGSRWRFPLVTLAMHAGYGVGTLRGIAAIPRFRAMLRPEAPASDGAAGPGRREGQRGSAPDGRAEGAR
jgi:succinoglycan biosynthesis protein ExoA